MLGENPPKVVWTIPVNFVSANYPSFNRTTPDVWLTGGEDFVTVPYVSDNDWIIANKKQTGYYRVNYDEKNWNLIKKALLGDHNKIDVLNRAQIIDDTFMLARSRQLAYDIPISIGLYLKQEKDYVAFYPFYRAIGYLDNILYSTNGRDKLKEYVNNVLQDTYKQLHFNENVNDKHTDKLNRINVLNWICKMDHADCRSTCLDKFRAWKDRKAIIPVNLQLSVFCGAMRVGSKHDHSTLHKAAKELKLDDRDLRSAMITSLGCSENEEILHSYLNSALEKDAVFGPDLVFPSVYTGGGVGVQAVLNLLLKQGKFEKLQQRSENIEDLLNGIASRISGDNQFEQLTRLSVTHDKSLFKRALEIAKTNKEWFSANGPALLEALDKANGSTLLTNIFILTIVSAATSIFYY
ncbi:aminopeptidase N-like [Photinus pyralis]|uniref:aminopeptidase N-like n=1 Tax=Photinus pyralis TaxID=7054 RepID=UPI0012676708|nr:aminopeptidase N-like [Photinus pyralis]